MADSVGSNHISEECFSWCVHYVRHCAGNHHTNSVSARSLDKNYRRLMLGVIFSATIPVVNSSAGGPRLNQCKGGKDRGPTLPAAAKVKAAGAAARSTCHPRGALYTLLNVC